MSRNDGSKWGPSRPRSGFVAAAMANDDAPRRFDFSRAGMAKRQSGAADRHGARVITDRFGNRRLVREGEELDLSYQDKYEITEHENADGTRTGYVDLRQDAFIEKIAELSKKMVTSGNWIRTSGPAPQIVSEEQMRKNIAEGDDPSDYRPVNKGALASLVSKAAEMGLATTDDLDEDTLQAAQLYDEDLHRRMQLPNYDETLIIEDATGDAMLDRETINPDIPTRVKKFGYGNRPPVSFDEDVDDEDIDGVFRSPRMEPAEISQEYKEMGRRIAKRANEKDYPKTQPVLAMCVGCGYGDLTPDMNFCPKCGIDTASAIVVCEHCGYEVSADMNFCPNCGRKISKQG